MAILRQEDAANESNLSSYFSVLSPDLWMLRGVYESLWSIQQVANQTAATRDSRNSFVVVFAQIVSPLPHEQESFSSLHLSTYKRSLPTFHVLIKMTQENAMSKIIKAVPNPNRDPFCLSWPRLVAWFGTLTCFCQVSLLPSAYCWGQVAFKYCVFFLASWGFWLDPMLDEVDLVVAELHLETCEDGTGELGPAKFESLCLPESKAKLADVNVNSDTYFQAMSSIIGTRAVVFQLVPELAIASVFAKSVAGSSVFILGSKRTPEQIQRILGPWKGMSFDEAKTRAREADDTLQNQKEPRGSHERTTTAGEYEYIVFLQAVNIMVTQPRLFVFIFNLYMFIISNLIMYEALSSAALFSSAILVIAYALVTSLSGICMLLKLAKVRDKDIVWDFTAEKLLVNRIVTMLCCPQRCNRVQPGDPPPST
jgi:hypothetical protein